MAKVRGGAGGGGAVAGGAGAVALGESPSVAAADGGTGEATVTDEQMPALRQADRDVGRVIEALGKSPNPRIPEGWHQSTTPAINAFDRSMDNVIGGGVGIQNNVNFRTSPTGRQLSRAVSESATWSTIGRNRGTVAFDKGHTLDGYRGIRNNLRSSMRTLNQARRR